MEKTHPHPKDTKKVFWNCGTCSQTFGHLLNREFGHLKENEERALDPLAGGIMNTGHQCGMLWGAALAVGAEAYRRYEDPAKAMATAITATRYVMDSFADRNQTVNCRDITHCDLTTTWGMTKLMVKTILGGFYHSPCFNLAAKWAPEAIHAAREGLAETHELEGHLPVSCASEMVRRMGASEEERVMVAGFASGLGLGGHGCGALAAAIWMKTLAWCKENPGKTPPFFKNPEGIKLLETLKEATQGKMRCEEITGQHFETLSDHAQYIDQGGCAELMDALAHSGK